MKKMSHENQPELNLPTRPLLAVLSGPSGVGKDSLIARIKKSEPPMEHIVTVTTRTKRAGEKDNVDYHFVTTEKFQQMIKNQELVEWANVYGNFYGVPSEPVKKALASGKDVLIKVDVQGAATLKKIFPQAIFIFLVPPSMEELLSRLRKRHTESSFDLELRIKTAREEMKKLPLFDYVVVDKQDKIDLALSTIKAIVTAEKHRTKPREVNL